MGIGKSLGFRAELIQVRSRNFVVRIVSLNIADPEIVSQYDDDIGSLGLSGDS